MSRQGKTKLQLAWIGKETRPACARHADRLKLEPRFTVSRVSIFPGRDA